MNSASFHGIFTILASPFREADLSLDMDDLRREVDFCLAGGAHGIVYPVMASEFHTLDDEERLPAVEAVIQRVAGQTPVMVGVTGLNDAHSLRLARHAQESGADAVIAMAPSGGQAPERFYEALDAAVDLPICVQNHAFGGLLPVETVVSLARASDNIAYIKEEGTPPLTRLEQAVEQGSDCVKGIFGGRAGVQFTEELRRGAVGNMPSCDWTDVQVRIFNLWDEGQRDQAEDLERRLLPALIMKQAAHGTRLAKATLKLRGVIRSDATRARVPAPTGADIDILERTLDQVRDATIDWN